MSRSRAPKSAVSKLPVPLLSSGPDKVEQMAEPSSKRAISDMKSERVEFRGSLGDRLAARLELPDDEPRAFALFAHCFTCGKDLKGVSRISRAMVEQGYGVLRFDFTGLGESDGDFAATNFTSNQEDLLAAVDFLRQHYRAPSLLVGHSLGGSAVLMVAGQVPEVQAVATLGAPSDTDHLRGMLLDAAPDLAAEDEVGVSLAGRPFKIRRQLLDDLEGHRVTAAVAKLRLPLLVMHSPIDTVVGVDHARRIFEAALHPKSFVSLDDADHLLLGKPADAEYVAAVLAAWAGRFVAPADSEQEATTPPRTASAAEQPPEGEVWVRGGAEGYENQVLAGRHRQIADEPLGVGGTDRGPTPYDYLLAALGACTGMTLRMYADRKKWPLSGTEVRLKHSRIHAKDCAECETESGKIDLIEREISLQGELDDQQRDRLMEIADRCPVHRSLTGEILVRSRQV